ncbi:MipA/OmpV family protein [Curvibacter sp. CHRR-16]|uniref:MipA/OmpV family protein n=1 Tax=Curvibacter sp. CHRR-16 TaxID=2835872 RepID=UPI001BDB5C8A|nr:MipA/OmpV family protein [Curvibacter sp. CHRR-16]MBT0569896.1 MipA/OmpV family protein [Curvibacter sp. CHRR-16]
MHAAFSYRRQSTGLVVAMLCGHLALIGTAQAQDAPDMQENKDSSSWSVGVMAMSNTKPYKNFDNKNQIWPLVTYENRWVRVMGPGLDVKLGRTGSVSYALTLSYAGDGYQSGDSPYLAGMHDRNSSVWVGGKVHWRNDWANMGATWQGDASSYSQGQKFQLSIDKRFAAGPIGISPKLAVTWLDKNYVDYYYGVTASEVRADRPSYTGSATTNTELSIRVDYPISRADMVFLDTGVTRFGNAIQDSPLIDRSSVTAVRIGYVHRF